MGNKMDTKYASDKMHIVAGRDPRYFCKNRDLMMTREEIAAIDRECEEQHISQQEYLDSHGIARHQYYRWKRKYREEDEQSLVPAGFVPMMPGAAPAQPGPAQRTKGRQQKPQDQESFLTVDMRKSFNGLSGIVTNGMCASLRSGDVYIFMNASRNIMKMLSKSL